MGAGHSLLAELLALLAAWRPIWYARRRHGLFTAATAHVTGVTLCLAMQGDLNIYSLHRGSALLLLFVMLVGNACLYQAIYFLHAQLSLAWSSVALPALAAAPMLASGATCSRLLEVPSALDPLQRAYSGLTLLQ